MKCYIIDNLEVFVFVFSKIITNKVIMKITADHVFCYLLQNVQYGITVIVISISHVSITFSV